MSSSNQSEKRRPAGIREADVLTAVSSTLIPPRAPAWAAVIGRVTDYLMNDCGGGPPHRHLGEDEVFTVIDGKFEFFDGESWMPFHRGEVKYSVRGSYHGFRNVGQSVGKMMFTTNGGGLDEYFAEISSLRLPDDMERLQEISRFYRYEYVPPRK